MEFCKKITEDQIKDIFNNIDVLKEILLQLNDESVINHFLNQLNFAQKELENIYIIP